MGGRRHFACCLGLQRSSDSSWASGGRRRESRGTASAAWKGPAPTHPPVALKMRPVPNAPLLSFTLATRPACAHHRARLAAAIFKRTKALSLGKEMTKPNSSVQSRSSNKKVNSCLLSSTFEPFTRKLQPVRERESHRIWVGAALGTPTSMGRVFILSSDTEGLRRISAGFFPPRRNPPTPRTGAEAETE